MSVVTVMSVMIEVSECARTFLSVANAAVGSSGPSLIS